MENKPVSLLVVSLGKALYGMPPLLCGRQVAPPVLHRIIIVKLLTQHVRRLLGTHQWQSALLVVGLPVTQDRFEMGCHLSSSPVVLNRGSMNPLGVRKGTLRGPYDWIRFSADKQNRFLAKVGTVSFRSRHCVWVDLQKQKKVTTYSLSL